MMACHGHPESMLSRYSKATSASRRSVILRRRLGARSYAGSASSAGASDSPAQFCRGGSKGSICFAAPVNAARDHWLKRPVIASMSHARTSRPADLASRWIPAQNGAPLRTWKVMSTDGWSSAPGSRSRYSAGTTTSSTVTSSASDSQITHPTR